MGPIEQNQDVVMVARPLCRQTCVLPPSYSLQACDSEDIGAWTAIQAAADRYNVITESLFEAAFGTDPSMHRERIFIARDEDGAPVGTTAAWFGEGEDRARTGALGRGAAGASGARARPGVGSVIQ